MVRILFVVFVIVPVIEIGIFLWLGQTIGILPTLLGVVATAVLGAVLVRIQGLSLITEIQRTLRAGQLPARALADAMMVAIAGVLMLTPGYFTDVLGILLLLPPVRTLIYRELARRFTVVATQTPRGPQTIDLDSSRFR